jgi:hypothetical protein
MSFLLAWIHEYFFLLLTLVSDPDVPLLLLPPLHIYGRKALSDLWRWGLADRDEESRGMIDLVHNEGGSGGPVVLHPRVSTHYNTKVRKLHNRAFQDF